MGGGASKQNWTCSIFILMTAEQTSDRENNEDVECDFKQ
jgi:hypothetical protein